VSHCGLCECSALPLVAVRCLWSLLLVSAAIWTVHVLAAYLTEVFC
jgi:hypothetical protein